MFGATNVESGLNENIMQWLEKKGKDAIGKRSVPYANNIVTIN